MRATGSQEQVRAREQEGGNILKAKSYRDLEIYQIAYKLAMKVHHMSLTLPKVSGLCSGVM